MWDIAPQFGAAIVFAEHRYYGESLPFGNGTYSNISTMAYLSSEQALGDFAVLIKYLKEKRINNATRKPVVSFGGSYGGMLTAWMRIKYPHLIVGGLASSAPVHYFENVTSGHSYFDITIRTFENSGCKLKSLFASFDAIKKLSNTTNGRKFLNKNYHLSLSSQIINSSQGQDLIDYFTGIMDTLATVDYPYPTNFITPLPGWPVKKACEPFINAKTTEELALALYNGLNLYYNYNNLKYLCLWGDDCISPPYSLGNNGDGWYWQTCTEMFQPLCARGPPFDPFDKWCPYLNEDKFNDCNQSYYNVGYTKELFRPTWIFNNYDPWSGGGWRQTTTNVGSLYSYVVEDSAHHYDLRGVHPLDTQSIKELRNKRKNAYSSMDY
uniref:Uncharacterized protein n=1 Tax=Meloidogyne enterolobii TaxID=390850 RepID=A0A6V7TST3_MELEN|nr:unnamed protein product [Meloidogyne enterolobii]